MITFPKAKINLGLRVLGKRDDGFHDIETIMYPINLFDALEFVEADKGVKSDEITTTGIDINTPPGRNIVMKAVQALRAKYDIPFLKIHLHKVIPPGSGLGGGSSDASHILLSINRFYRLGIEATTMNELAASIGSDCPFFLNPTPSLAQGKGEKLTPLSPFLSGYYIILSHPAIPISTKEAYTNCAIHSSRQSLTSLIEYDASRWKSLIQNDFEEYVFKIHPLVEELKEAFYESGAIYSSMSGSGSSVYGIFKERPTTSAIIERKKIFEGWL